MSQLPVPSVEILDNRRICISGLPEATDTDLQDASITKVVHQIKNLFGEGDRFGTKGRKYRSKHGLPEEHVGIRIYFTHTYTRNKEGDVIVGLWYNSAEPATRIDRHHQPTEPLSPEEIELAMTAIVKICAQEIREHLGDIDRKAKQNGEEPNFYIGTLPNFYGNLATVPAR